jgi:hypothetical protein
MVAGHGHYRTGMHGSTSPIAVSAGAQRYR